MDEKLSSSKIRANHGFPNTSMPEPLSKPCSICLDLLRHEKLHRYYIEDGDKAEIPGLTPEDCEYIFHKQRASPPGYYENLCTFCAHLRVELLKETWTDDLVKPRSKRAPRMFGDTSYETIQIALGQISDIQARKNSCFLCARITEILILKGNIDASRLVCIEISAGDVNWISIGLRGEHDYETLLPDLYTRTDYSNKRKKPDFTIDYSASDIYWPSVRKWVEDSLENAKESPEIVGLCKPPDGFRLVDVRKLCVLRATTPCEYVCLSYVWGANISAQATSKNISGLEQPGSLKDLEDLPRTIQDAIEACKHLQKRYLWVDRLCIVQDEDNSAQINSMGDIYRGAVVTIVALEGSDSNYGLHGVSSERARCPRFHIGRTEFRKMPDSLHDSCGKSTWNTRGWTLQESIISRRLLLFTKNGLFYQSDTESEVKTDVQQWALREASTTKLFHHGYNAEIFDYSGLVSEIDHRDFGKEEDIVAAFTGALNLFVGKENHRFSMSFVHFDQAITWHYTMASRSHRSTDSSWIPRKARDSTPFPSWSWVSVIACIEFAERGFAGPRFVPCASWAVIDSTAEHEFRWLKARGENVLEAEVIMIGTILWSYGCMRSEFPHDLSILSGSVDYLKLFKHKFPTQEAFNEACGVWPGGQQSNQASLERFTPQQIEAGRQPLSILAHSQTIMLTLTPDELEDWWTSSYQGRCLGGMNFTFDLRSEDDKARKHTAIEMEFLAVSVSWWDWDKRGEDYWYPKSVDKPDQAREYKPTDLDFYLENDNVSIFHRYRMNVIAIRTTDDGISRRLGFGRIPLATWLTALKPTFKSVVLQ